MFLRQCVVLFVVSMMVAGAAAQETNAYSRRNTFTVFAEGSAPSTPLIVGTARQRLLLSVGAAYTRRLLRFRGSDLGYHVEVRPVLFESDPLAIVNEMSTPLTGPTAGMPSYYAGSDVPLSCTPASASGTIPASPPNFPGYTYSSVQTCGRQWTFGQSFAPLGFQYSLRTRHRVQPFVVGTLGYMYTSRPVPTPQSEAFNFVVNFGVGVEVYRAARRSVSLEARVQHFSNKDTAQENPGTDNVTIKASYSFGR